jgi:two-component system, sensor histidine kinase and response regulator
MRVPINVLFIQSNSEDGWPVEASLHAGHIKTKLHLEKVDRIDNDQAQLASKQIEAVLFALPKLDHDGLTRVEYVMVNAPTLPVIVLTAHEDEEMARRFLQRGVQDVLLVKGQVDGDALTHSIQYAIQRKQADGVSQAKKEFLANMSHEILTPMNGVSGMLQLAMGTALTTEQRDYLQTALHSAEALLSLLHDMLDFSKIESGQLALANTSFNLRQTIENIAHIFALRAQDKGLKLRCVMPADLPFELLGDPGRLRQILVNLVDNAIKFTHVGEVEIRVQTLEETERDSLIRFAVQDTGIGIIPERQAIIFDLFTQADGSVNRKYGGTGLGLTISHQLVEAMGGQIQVESSSGIGSTFWFDLRLEKKPREKRGTGPLTLGPPNLIQTHILIVDGDRAQRTVLRKNVETLGSRVDDVSHGAKAMDLLRKAYRENDPYHVILLDLYLPDMDSEQTVRAIKSDPVLKDVKIILTSVSLPNEVAPWESHGCAGYLSKPVEQQMLFDAILAVLNGKIPQSSELSTALSMLGPVRSTQPILLVEDHPINQQLALILLQAAGYAVDIAETGRQALEKVQGKQYSAVLMDIQMPMMDGLTATRRIRELESTTGQHIPIIAMTAHALAGDRENCLAAGMDDYVSKPLEPDILFKVLNRWTQSAVTSKEIENSQAYVVAMEEGMFGEEPSPDSRKMKTMDTLVPILSSRNVLPVDLELALKHFSGNHSVMMNMFSKYLDQLPEYKTEMDAALQHRDRMRLIYLAHNLRGVSLNFCAEPLANITRHLEQMCKGADLTDAPSLLLQLEAEMNRLKDYASNHQL